MQKKKVNLLAKPSVPPGAPQQLGRTIASLSETGFVDVKNPASIPRRLVQTCSDKIRSDPIQCSKQCYHNAHLISQTRSGPDLFLRGLPAHKKAITDYITNTCTDESAACSAKVARPFEQVFASLSKPFTTSEDCTL